MLHGNSESATFSPARKSASSSALVFGPQQREFFKTHGYCILRKAIPENVLAVTEKVVYDWVTIRLEDWRDAGLLKDLSKYDDMPIEERLITAWNDAEQPNYNRRALLYYNVYPSMFELLRNDFFVNLAQEVLGTQEIACSPVNNPRPKHHSLPWSQIPWHADMYYWEEAQKGTPMDFMVMWYPLAKVTAQTGCLQAISTTECKGADFTVAKGSAALNDEVVNGKTIVDLEMDRGDLLLMNDQVLHRSTRNMGKTLTWTMDQRYENASCQTRDTRENGFVVRSTQNPMAVASCADWMKKRHPRPADAVRPKGAAAQALTSPSGAA